MKQQDNCGTNNESIIIEDLNAPHAEDIKGGPSTKSWRDVILKTSATGNQTEDDDTLRGFSLNHNETVASDTDSDDEASATKLADLAVAEEQEEQVKGGLPAVQRTTNHNETLASDDEAETESLEDLPAKDSTEVKGGPFHDSGIKVYIDVVYNHTGEGGVGGVY